LLKARELGLPEGDISTLRSPKIKIEGNPIKINFLLKSILAMISFKDEFKNTNNVSVTYSSNPARMSGTG
jgi:hypothetical protein